MPDLADDISTVARRLAGQSPLFVTSPGRSKIYQPSRNELPHQELESSGHRRHCNWACSEQIIRQTFRIP